MAADGFFAVSVLPAAAAASPYVQLLTSEHRGRPKFASTVLATTSPATQSQATLATLFTLFDLDTAVGAQLDAIGLWIGRSRYLSTPLVGVYLTWDQSGVGWDQGVWQGPYDPSSGLVALDDATYRLYLKAVSGANRWDGTIPGAYAVLQPLFTALGSTILIFDNQDMTMNFLLLGPAPPPIIKALFSGGYLSFKPAGVTARDYYTSPGPAFAFDAQNANLAGFDTGLWAAKV